MQKNKGDLWKINFSDFGFTDGCITIGEISGASIVENSNDGWNIDSIVTLVKDNRGGVEVLTQDLDVCFIGLMVIIFQWHSTGASILHLPDTPVALKEQSLIELSMPLNQFF